MKIALFTALLVVVATLSFAVGPYMHESDQASILYGASRISEGRDSPFAANFYNYDKQYVTYWLVAAAHRVLPGVSLVTLGNAMGFAFFWGGLAIFLAGAGLRRLLPVAGLAACILAPTFLVHSPFLATTFFAAGFVFLGAACWRLGRRWPWLKFGALACLALGVGSRGDIILILPLIAWLAVPVSRWWRLATRPWAYAIGAMGIVALVVGKLIMTESSSDILPPFFYPKIFVVFTIFGLGAAVLVLPVCVAAMAGWSWRRWRQGRATGSFYLIGACGLLLPFAWYSAQLFSPRYWVVGLCGLILLLASRRGERLLEMPRRLAPPVLAVTWGLAAILPLFVGLHLAALTKPSLVVTEPTTFPTADGLMPMGALAWQILHQRFAPQGIVDHNQATWLAAKATDFKAGSDGMVPLLFSPLRTILQFAVEMQGKESRNVTADEPFFYTELRRIVRAGNVFTSDKDSGGEASLKKSGFTRVSPVTGGGYAIIVGRAGTVNDPEIDRALALAKLFDGREYLLLDEGAVSSGILGTRAFDAKAVVLFSSKPFEVTGAGGSDARVQSEPSEVLGQVVVLPPADRGRSRLRVTGAAPVRGAFARLPDFMSGSP